MASSNLSLSAKPDAVPGDVALGWSHDGTYGVHVIPAYKAEDYARAILEAVAEAREAMNASVKPKDAA